jgi:NAD+-dependent secondary alcohol dehydrogenase Adh1
VVDGRHVDSVLEVTDGNGAEAVIDCVGEKGATIETRTYPLEAINDAIADLDGGRLQGRGILIPEAA